MIGAAFAKLVPALLLQWIAFGPASLGVRGGVQAANPEPGATAAPEVKKASADDDAVLPPTKSDSKKDAAAKKASAADGAKGGGEIKRAPEPPPKPTEPKRESDTKAPVDIQPANCRDSGTCPTVSKAKPGEKIIIVGEDFALQGGYPSSATETDQVAAAPYVTETDRVVVRFIVRKALACRVYAQADATVKWQPSVFRYGGEVPAIQFPKEARREANEFLPREVSSPSLKSCGIVLDQSSDDPPQLVPRDTGYTWVDFRMGPFTDDEITIHLYRFDRGFTGYDREGAIKITNHRRYTGWIDLAGGVNALASEARTAAVVQDPFSGVSRVALKNSREAQLDFMAFVKVFLKCDGNPAFERVDLQASTLCVGVGAGLSLRDPLDRFYPFGVNLTFGGSVSLNAMLSLSRVHTASSDLAAGTFTTADANTLNQVSSIKPGFALALGVDPSIFASIVKAAVGFK